MEEDRVGVDQLGCAGSACLIIKTCTGNPIRVPEIDDLKVTYTIIYRLNL